MERFVLDDNLDSNEIATAFGLAMTLFTVLVKLPKYGIIFLCPQ